MATAEQSIPTDTQELTEAVIQDQDSNYHLRRAVIGSILSASAVLAPQAAFGQEVPHHKSASETTTTAPAWSQSYCKPNSLVVPGYSDAENYLVNNPQLMQQPLTAEATALAKLACTPTATWIYKPRADISDGYNIEAGIKGLLKEAAQQNRTAEIVLYEIPDRDAVGGASAGGARTDAQYQGDVRAYAKDIKASGAKVDLIIEPDALPDTPHLPKTRQATRIADIKYAMTHLDMPGVDELLDNGNPQYEPAQTMANLDWQAGECSKVKEDLQFNTSNTFSEAQIDKYGVKVINDLKAIAVKHKVRGCDPEFSIDSSRNGEGHSASINQSPAKTAAGKYPNLNVKGVEDLKDRLYVNYPGGIDATKTEDGVTYYAGQWSEQDAVKEVNSPYSGLVNIKNFTLPPSPSN